LGEEAHPPAPSLDLVRVEPRLTFGPDDTFAGGRGHVVSSGGRALFPAIVQNNGPAAAAVTFTSQVSATPAGSVAPVVVYTDPDGDGDPRDGQAIQSLAAVPPLGGHAHVVVAVSATSPLGQPLPMTSKVHVEAVARAGDASATKIAEAQVGYLTACSDASCTGAAARFVPCEPVTVRADGLSPAAAGYVLRWYAGTTPPTAGSVAARERTLVVDGEGVSTDTFALAAEAAGVTVTLVDSTGTVVDTLVLTADGEAKVTLLPDAPPYVGGAPFHALARLENRVFKAAVRGTRLRWTIKNPAGEVMSPAGTFAAGAGPTRLSVGLDVAAGGSAEDALAVAAAGFGGIGRYVLSAEWLLSCREAPFASGAVNLDVPPPSPTLSSPAPGSTVDTNRPRFAGTATASASVTVDVDGKTLGPVTAAADGTWALDPTEDLEGGDRVAHAIQTVKGAPSQPSPAVAFRIGAAEKSGCGCRSSGNGSGALATLLFLALAASALAPRRRRGAASQ
jgi:hypothetical protein